MKGAFINCNTINDKKQEQLCNQLNKYDFIGLGELNKTWDFENTDKFQYHTNPSTPRIGFIAVNTLDFEYVGIGLKIDDVNRSNIEMYKTLVASGIYKIRSKGHILYVEVFYLVPALASEHVETVVNHLTNQVNRYKSYIGGGDMNQNWLDNNCRNFFKNIYNCNQIVRKHTRVSNYLRDGRSRTSKSVIDLIFCNNKIKNLIKEHGVSDMNSTTVQGLREFDHFAPWIDISIPSACAYVDITIPNDPTKRPNPDPNQMETILEQIHMIPDTFRHDYGRFFLEISNILDQTIPAPPKNSTSNVRIYKQPLTPEAINLINIKRKLYKKRKKSELARKKFRQVSNKVKKIVQKVTSETKTNLIIQASKPESSAKQLEKKIKQMENLKNANISKQTNKNMLIVQGFSKNELALQVGKFCQKRSSMLVTDEEVINAGPPPPALYPNEPRRQQADFNWPDFSNIDTFLPKNKRTRTHGPEHISASILAKIWPAISSTINQIFQNGALEYPQFYQGYYQHMIPKGGLSIIEIFKHLRPLGNLNAFPKYFLNKVIFKSIRAHMTPILENRNNYTYKGVHLCVIDVFDFVKNNIKNKIPTLLVKYDFSNAFGTLFHDHVLTAAEEIGLHPNVIHYIQTYLRNQKWTETVIKDDYGVYISPMIKMDRGTVQGQIGSDVLFVIQQICFKALENIRRSSYMDDINDISYDDSKIVVEPEPGLKIELKKIDKDKSSKNTVTKALENERILIEQSQKVGFAINAGKTRYIPFNIDDNYLLERGISADMISRECDLLGFPFIAKTNGISIEPAAKMIINRINKRSIQVHALRNHTNNIDVRVKACRKLTYSCLGELHLVWSYDTRCKKHFHKIKTATNKMIRATGLRIETPQFALNSVLGTDLEEFAKQGVVLNGIKRLKSNLAAHMPRQNIDPANSRSMRASFNIQLKEVADNYMSNFEKVWNDYSESEQIQILSKIENFDRKPLESVKNLLKGWRKLGYDPKIHEDFKYVKY